MPKLSLCRGIYTFSEILIDMKLLNITVSVLHAFRIYTDKSVILMES